MRILICDDSKVARRSLASFIASSFDGEIIFAENGRQALETMQCDNIDILFLDLTMPEMDGFEVLTDSSRIQPSDQSGRSVWRHSRNCPTTLFRSRCLCIHRETVKSRIGNSSIS
ncbi:response regulator [Vibrio mediterranei]|uniref:response regulator n=1 Tax=Vibrio mediterranei TaxID=689 RepID=UPI0038CED3AE